MARPAFASLAVIVAVVALALPANASVLQGFTVQELQERAELVVTGRVLSSEALFTGRTIETRTRVAVSRAFGGDAETVTVVTPGGRFGGRVLRVAGVPSFEVGEEVLLFLYRSAGEWHPVGMFQGVWRLDPRRPDVAMASTATGAALREPDSGEAAVARAERSLRALVGGGR